jgi:hypothetical protein
MIVLNERFIRPLLEMAEPEYSAYLAALAPEDRLAVEQAILRAKQVCMGDAIQTPRKLANAQLQMRVALIASTPNESALAQNA